MVIADAGTLFFLSRHFCQLLFGWPSGDRTQRV